MNPHEDTITPIIMHCKALTPKAIKFKSKLGFKQHDLTLTKKHSVVPKIMELFANEKALPQHAVLGCTIDLYFPEHKLAIEVDEKGHDDRDIDYEIKRQKAIERDRGCKFIRSNPDKKDYNEYVEIG